MPDWPESLPQQFLQRGYVEGFGDNVIRSPVDAGIEKTRRRFTAVARPLTGRMLLTKAQLDTFRTFYTDTIGDGSLEFDFPKPNEPDETYTVKFRSAPSWSNPGGNNYDITLELNILP